MEKIKLYSTSKNIKNLIGTAVTLVLLLILLYATNLQIGEKKISYLANEEGTKIYFISAILMLICASLAFLMALFGMFIPEEMMKTKMIMETLTKMMLLIIIILAIVILATVINKESASQISWKTYFFLSLFAIVAPLATIIFTFDKNIYLKKA